MHTSVLQSEVVSYFQELATQVPRVALDCTAGGGGHSRALLEASPELRIVALDRDEEAVKRCRNSLSDYPGRIQVLHGNFGEAQVLLERHWSSLVRALDLPEELPGAFGFVLADLGFSSFQIEEGERGLSFQKDGPLDMRLDRSQGRTAAELINSLDERELLRVLRRGGVGPEAKAVVRAMVGNRPLETTRQLAGLCERSVPKALQVPGRHPATVVFQALRIEVNGEISALEGLLAAAPELLAAGGRLAVISFHSLEDRLVAKTMRSWQRPKLPAKLPVRGPAHTMGKLLTPSAVAPGEQEISANPRARSARLRVFELH